jgi:hypothetical protein
VEDMNGQMEFLLLYRGSPGYEERVEAIKYKVSAEFTHVLKNYVDYLQNEGIVFKDVIYNGSMIVSKEELSRLLQQDYSYFPLARRLDKIRRRVFYLLEPHEKERRKQVQAELEAIYQTVAEICLAEDAWDVLIADTIDRQSTIWEARGAFLEAMKAMSEIDEVDVVVPIHLIGEFINYTEELSKKYGMRILSFGHAGDGNCHIYILRDEIPKEKWKNLVDECMDEMYARGFLLGGNVSGEHGIGIAKRRFLEVKAGETHMSIMRAIKNSMDPKNILNPGKVV